MGLSVVPVEGKRAVAKDWSRWCNEEQPEDLINEWQKEFPFPRFGVGICCGPASNLDALDVDSNSRDIIDICPRSPINRLGARGGMLIFRHNPKILKRKADRDNLCLEDPKNKEGVQLLSTGNYFVAPPSIHPDTRKPYSWIGNYSLENFSILDLEQLTQDQVDAPCVYISRFTLTRADGSVSMGGIGGRNDKLTVICYAKIKNNLWMSDEEIAEELVEYDSNNHCPPYFIDPEEMYFRRGGSPFLRALFFVRWSRDRMRKKGDL